MQNENILTLPFVPMRGMIMFPRTVLHFDVGRKKSTAAIDYAIEHDRRIFIATQKDAEIEEPGAEDIFPVGTIAEIRQVLHLSGDNMRVLAEGISRAKLLSADMDKDGYFAEVKEIPPFNMEDMDENIQVLMRSVKEYFEEYAVNGNKISPELLRAVKRIEDPEDLVNTIASSTVADFNKRIEILSIEETDKRLMAISAFLAQEKELAGIERMLQLKVKMQLDKTREYYLREQMRVIQEELGENESELYDEFAEKAAKLPLNKEAKEKVEKEIDRLNRLMPGSPEAAVSENYVRHILELPWGKYTEDNMSLERARQTLDENHYGMKEVKERIIEFLAVKSMQKSTKKAEMKGSILCFVGPPGVGKTSIVKAIAKSMGRKFIQMSLGGVRDEAEIYGHKKHI